MVRAWPVPLLDKDAPVAGNARRIVSTRVAELYSWEPAVGLPSAVTEHHAMRISAKRLRYSLELFEDVFGDRATAAMAGVREVQALLGTLHDIDVRIQLIDEELAACSLEHARGLGPRLAAASSAEQRSIVSSALRPPPDDPRRGLVSLLSRQHRQRQDHHRRFVERWAELQQEGMRRRLVSLSSPLVDLPEVLPVQEGAVTGEVECSL